MTRRRRPLVALLALVLVADVAVLGSQSTRSAPSAPGRRFLERFVEPDGRVVRHDQGGDTVSEGQAYALLVAAGLGDRRRFATVWEWTRTHLQRPDGLFSWHWKDGRVIDGEPAADADLDMARALLTGAHRFRDERHAVEANRVAAAVRRKETEVVAGTRVLLPGPWAVGRRPVPVNPSYLAPRTFALFGWDDMVGFARRVVDDKKPPRDWVLMGDDGSVRPDGGYGYEAVRVPIRLAESPDPADRALAAGMWPALRHHRLTPQHPVAMVAAAAAATAAGDRDAARRLLDRADRRDRRQPTYYGAAWVALGDLWLNVKDEP